MTITRRIAIAGAVALAFLASAPAPAHGAPLAGAAVNAGVPSDAASPTQNVGAVRLTVADMDAIQGDGWLKKIKKWLQKAAKVIKNPLVKLILEIVVLIITIIEFIIPDNDDLVEEHYEGEETTTQFYDDDAALAADISSGSEYRSQDYVYQYTTVTPGGGGGGGCAEAEGCYAY